MFKQWLAGIPVSFISQVSGKNQGSIRRLIQRFLYCSPWPRPVTNYQCHLVIDTTWFGKDNCLIVYWDTDKKRAQWWRYSSKENLEEILADLEQLKKSGVVLVSSTSDGAPGILGALSLLYPNIPHQRCLVHLQRMALAFLTQRPKTVAGWELRSLVMKLNRISIQEEHDYWRRDFLHWCNRYYSFLKQRSFYPDGRHWWYTHRYLRRVRRMIINALPNMWHYLEDKKIPKDTNGLEGRWNSLKDHFRRHRGLSCLRRKAYLSWYLSVVVNGERPTRNDY